MVEGVGDVQMPLAVKGHAVWGVELARLGSFLAEPPKGSLTKRLSRCNATRSAVLALLPGSGHLAQAFQRTFASRVSTGTGCYHGHRINPGFRRGD
jgi:hypothetical protein